MLFQTLDDKADCVGIFLENELIFDIERFPDTLSRTWKYAPYLRGRSIDYAWLYLEGQNLRDHLPEYLRDDWEDIQQKMKAFRRSLEISRVNLDDTCFYDLVPQRFLMELCGVKNKITEHVFKAIPRPSRYEFYKHVDMMLADIAARSVCLEERYLHSHEKNPKLRNQIKAMRLSPHVKYNQFGTKTGRLTTRPNTFPILTLNTTLRSAVYPTNDYFVELDFNGAEVRTLLGLLGKSQPQMDVHDYHLTDIFKSLSTRDEAKVAFFAWLYGSRQAASTEEAQELSTFYKKEKLVEKYYSGGTIKTPYGKEIKNVTPHHALNYLVQSTAAELTLKQALKLEFLLRRQGAGSFIAFLVHDAIILDMKKEDEHLLPSLKSLMESTNFGKFLLNMKKGPGLGKMKEYICG